MRCEFCNNIVKINNDGTIDCPRCGVYGSSDAVNLAEVIKQQESLINLLFDVLKDLVEEAYHQDPFSDDEGRAILMRARSVLGGDNDPR